MSFPARFALFVGAALTLASVSAAAAQLDLSQPGLVAPSFRGQANTTYFGWDVFEPNGTPGAFGNSFLDDSTPDLGTDPGGARIVQDASLPYGHTSGSFNYYSGFGETDLAGDTITAPTSGTVGPNGYTTLIVQLLGNAPTTNGSNPIEDMTFDSVNGVTPTVYYGLDASGTFAGGGHYLVVYELAGNQAAYDIHFASLSSSRGITAITVDMIYSETAGAFADAVVPEPAALAAFGLFGGVAMLRRRFA